MLFYYDFAIFYLLNWVFFVGYPWPCSGKDNVIDNKPHQKSNPNVTMLHTILSLVLYSANYPWGIPYGHHLVSMQNHNLVLNYLPSSHFSCVPCTFSHHHLISRHNFRGDLWPLWGKSYILVICIRTKTNSATRLHFLIYSIQKINIYLWIKWASVTISWSAIIIDRKCDTYR